MNESEKDRILRMLSEGALRPQEAAQLLAALAEPKPAAQSKPEPEPAKPMTEIKLQRPDGTYYTVQVPPDLVPMVWAFAKVAIKESARTAAAETWQGLKNLARNKADEAKTALRERVSRERSPAKAGPTAEPQQDEARRRILQMVQNGRISAADASRLLEQLEAFNRDKAA